MSRTRFYSGQRPQAVLLNLALDELESLFTGTPVSSAPSGQFYQDRGAFVARYSDRLLVGAASDNKAFADRDATPRDWLSNVMGAHSTGAYATWGAQGASLSRKGTIGWLGGSRTSDARASAAQLGYTPASIGVASWGINDDTVSPTTTTAWAFYGEAWRMSGVNYQPTFGMELELVNFGGADTATPNPYRVNIGGGTVGLQMGAGGGQTSGTFDCTSVFTTVANPNKFKTGIIFGALAHAGVDDNGDGFASVIEMARGQALLWRTPETRAGVRGIDFGGFIRSTVAAAVNASRLEFQDSGIVISNANGQPIFAAGGNPVSNSYISTFAGTGTNPPGLNAYGDAADIDMRFYPRGTGTVRVRGNEVWHDGNGAVHLAPYAPLSDPGFGVRVRYVDPTQFQVVTTISGAATDAKNSDVLVRDDGVRHRLLSDDQSTFNNWLAVTRSGTTATGITMTATAVIINGTVSVLLNGSSKTLVVGAADSAGAGFRTVRVAN